MAEKDTRLRVVDLCTRLTIYESGTKRIILGVAEAYHCLEGGARGFASVSRRLTSTNNARAARQRGKHFVRETIEARFRKKTLALSASAGYLAVTRTASSVP